MSCVMLKEDDSFNRKPSIHTPIILAIDLGKFNSVSVVSTSPLMRLRFAWCPTMI